MNWKTIALLVLGSMGMWACGDPKGGAVEVTPMEEAKTMDAKAETPAAAPANYAKFEESFAEVELPHIIGPDMNPKMDAIPMDLQMEFLGRGNETTRPYGRFAIADGFDVLATVEDPTEGVHYIVLNVFSQQGELLSHREIAGDDGSEYSAFIRADKKVSVSEAPNAENGLKEAKETLFQIDADGKIVEVQE